MLADKADRLIMYRDEFERIMGPDPTSEVRGICEHAVEDGLGLNGKHPTVSIRVEFKTLVQPPAF